MLVFSILVLKMNNCGHRSLNYYYYYCSTFDLDVRQSKKTASSRE